jgi:hypothetical protein
MKRHAILVVTSQLSILLLTLHITDDIVRGLTASGSHPLGHSQCYSSDRVRRNVRPSLAGHRW